MVDDFEFKEILKKFQTLIDRLNTYMWRLENEE